MKRRITTISYIDAFIAKWILLHFSTGPVPNKDMQARPPLPPSVLLPFS